MAFEERERDSMNPSKLELALKERKRQRGREEKLEGNFTN